MTILTTDIHVDGGKADRLFWAMGPMGVIDHSRTVRRCAYAHCYRQRQGVCKIVHASEAYSAPWYRSLGNGTQEAWNRKDSPLAGRAGIQAESNPCSFHVPDDSSIDVICDSSIDQREQDEAHDRR